MKRYLVEVNEVCTYQVGERYTWDVPAMSEPENVYSGESLDEARKAFASVVEGWDGGMYDIIQPKSGLPAVVYQTVELSVLAEDDEGELEFERVEAFARSLPKAVEERLHKLERGYWAFLDYEEDYYSTQI